MKRVPPTLQDPKNHDELKHWCELVARSINYSVPLSGSTLDRPKIPPDENIVGLSYFDTTLGKPIWWNGVNWIDSIGGLV